MGRGFKGVWFQKKEHSNKRKPLFRECVFDGTACLDPAFAEGASLRYSFFSAECGFFFVPEVSLESCANYDKGSTVQF